MGVKSIKKEIKEYALNVFDTEQVLLENMVNSSLLIQRVKKLVHAQEIASFDEKLRESALMSHGKSQIKGDSKSGSSSVAAIKLNMIGLSGERMVVSLQTSNIDDISIAMVHQQFFDQMMADGKKKSILPQNIQLFHHGIALHLNKTLNFYGISNSTGMIYARHKMNGGMDSTTYLTNVRYLGSNKVNLQNGKREMCLYLGDSEPKLPHSICKNLTLLYRKKFQFSWHDMQSVQRCIRSWADENFSYTENPQRLLAFSLQGNKNGKTAVGSDTDLASLHAYVHEHCHLKLHCIPTYKPPFLTVSNVSCTRKMKNVNSNGGGGKKQENWKNLYPLKWAPEDVQLWLRSFGPPVSNARPAFAGLNGVQMFIIASSNRKLTNLLGCNQYYTVQMLTGKVKNILQVYNINDRELEKAEVQETLKTSVVTSIPSVYPGNAGGNNFVVDAKAFFNQYSVGDKLEVLDFVGNWCLTSILKKKQNRVFLITYVGWSSRWNESIQASTSTICNCPHICRVQGHRLALVGSQMTYAHMGSRVASSGGTVKKKVQTNFTGVVPLQNQGNTCYMNSSIQALLQTPDLIQYLRAHPNGSGNTNTSQAVQSSVYNTMSNMLFSSPVVSCDMSLLDAFGDLAKEAEAGNDVRPANIRSILCSINPRFGSGAQDDTSLVLSTILSELDKNCASEYAAKNDESIAGRFNISYAVTLEEELDSDDEEFYIEEDILPNHNPFNSLIRKTMDGVEKVVTSCMTCGSKKVKYCTFREMQLPLMSNNILVQVDVWCPALYQEFEKITYQLLNYCSIDVLRAQIAQDIGKIMESGQKPTFKSVTICALFSDNNANTIDQWLHFYNANTICSSLPTQVFAIVHGVPQQLQADNDGNNNRSEMKDNMMEVNHNVRYLMRYEIVLKKNGQPTKAPDMTVAAQFVCMEPGQMYDGKKLLKKFRNANSLLLPHAKKSNYNLQLFLANQFVRPTENYMIDGMTVIVLLWVNAKTSTNSIPRSKKHVVQFMKSQHIGSAKYWSRPKPMNDIRDSLTLYEKSIVLDEQRATFNCDICETSHVFQEQRTIVYAPQILVLIIDRYGENSSSGKFNHMVKYPVTEPLVLGRQTSTGYDLFATCNHSSSSMKYGHYTANVKSFNNGSWYHTSDAQVRSIGTRNVMSSETIVLLYSKIE